VGPPNAVAVLRALVFGQIAGRQAADFAANIDAMRAGQK
jgi:succinate dehydrogenase/fumarate reductase flavoprotein subunit